MLDLLLIPAAALLVSALRAVHRGDHRLHGHLMAAAVVTAAMRIVLHPQALPLRHRLLGTALLGVAGLTLLLGRLALAWREGRSLQPRVARIHRAVAAFTLALSALAGMAWLLRDR